VQTVGPTDAAARCMMTNPDYFPNWRADVRNIMTLYLHHTGVSRARQAMCTAGMGLSGNRALLGLSLDYSPMEMAVAHAQYGYSPTANGPGRMARRQLILSTYHFPRRPAS